MDILDDMGVSKISANVFLKVNYSFKAELPVTCHQLIITWPSVFKTSSFDPLSLDPLPAWSYHNNDEHHNANTGNHCVSELHTNTVFCKAVRQRWSYFCSLSHSHNIIISRHIWTAKSSIKWTHIIEISVNMLTK